MSRRAVGFAVAAAVGFAVGLLWWTREQEEHRRALFSPRPMRRLAALGWLSGQPTAETVVMLREYLGWESNPVLRRRARRLLSRFENALA
ncbi:MAG: hypothetical protein OEW77_08295 [Gemmatimonadota bacterium]|nr:hypothetical protein [Gemmatimonadota bacterium]